MIARRIGGILKGGSRELLFAMIIGIGAFLVSCCARSALAEPLLISLLIGIVVKALIKKPLTSAGDAVKAPAVLIPFGISFYAMANLNFVRISRVNLSIIFLLIVIILVYFATVLLCGKLLGQKKKISYLIATGSAICGASAITITSPAIDAEPDDISISLLATALIGFIGLFIILPFIATLLDITNKTYGILSGSVLQFTGFVKTAVKDVSFLFSEISQKELVTLALSIKAARYLGLLVAIPLFASFVKKAIYVPWFLWLFLGTGILGSVIYANNPAFYCETVIPLVTPLYTISWSIVMAAIGLDVDIKKLLSNNGTKALIMAFVGFCAAIITFFIGYNFI